MAYCEQCGQLVKSGARFCESCGARVATAIPATGAMRGVGLAESAERGLLVTNVAALAEQLNVYPAQVSDVISAFCRDAVERGVRYELLDLGNVATDDLFGQGLSLLRVAVQRACAKYLFIVGNEEIVDVVRWENGAGDSDEIVESDLALAALDDVSPWDGVNYDIYGFLRVGRLPTYDGEPFAAFARYFENVARVGSFGPFMPYGLSARVWQAESDDIFGHLSPVRVDASPSITCDTVSSRLAHRPNFFFFNLHGSDRERFWYGQNGSSYPEAFSPELMASVASPFVLATEACYGARFLDGLTPKDSALFAAMTGQCLSFLGSSRIAYGMPRPKGTCADIVVGEFLCGIREGLSVGDAHIESLRQLCSQGRMDDSDVKTLTEFALYGDPSLRFGIGQPEVKTTTSRRTTGLSVALPDVRLAVRMALAACDARIERLVDELVSQTCAEWFGGIPLSAFQQKTFRLPCLGLNQKMYWTDEGCFSRTLKVYFDDGGNLRKAVESK